MTFYNISQNYGNNYINIGVSSQENSKIINYNTVLIIPTSSYSAINLIDTLNDCLNSANVVDSLGNVVNDSNNI